VAVVGLAVVVGLLCGRAMSPSSKGPSQQEQQRNSGSLPMAAQQSSGSLESVPAAQPAGATASSREVEDLRKQKKDAEEKLETVTKERDTCRSDLTAAAAKSAEQERERSKVEKRNAEALREQIKDFKQKWLESKATQFALMISLVDGKPPAAGAAKEPPEFRGVLSAISILKGQSMAAIDVPLASDWSKALADTLLEYRAIEVLAPDNNVPKGFYWCRTSDLPKLNQVPSQVDLFSAKGLQKWDRSTNSPKAKEVADYPLKELHKEIADPSSVASVRALLGWMVKFDSRVVSDSTNRIGVAQNIKELRLPGDIWETVVSEALQSVETQLTWLSKRDPKPSDLDAAFERLRRAKQLWTPPPRSSDEKPKSRWERAKAELETWLKNTASTPEIVFYGVLSVEDGGASVFGYPVPPLPGAVRPRQGSLYAVNDGKPSKIGTVIDGNPTVESSAAFKLDGCPVIFVPTSPGAKGSAAEVPSE
jgi:hypothetical protein